MTPKENYRLLGLLAQSSLTQAKTVSAMLDTLEAALVRIKALEDRLHHIVTEAPRG